MLVKSLACPALPAPGVVKNPQSPIEYVIILQATSQKRATEQLAKVSIIGPILESQRSSVADIGCKLLRKSLTKFFDRHLSHR